MRITGGHGADVVYDPVGEYDLIVQHRDGRSRQCRAPAAEPQMYRVQWEIDCRRIRWRYHREG